MLNHHWYFEAAFADEFNKNTVAAGYIGDGYLKSARISNRKIIFPSLYSVDDVNRGIGGGENQAPGISFNWKGDNWQADTAMRYDLIRSREKTWYGKNSVSVNEIALSNFNTGTQYVLPKESLVKNVKAVYVESSSGDLRDSKGRKYKKLDDSQYLLLSKEYQILLSKDSKAYRQSGVLPAVAVTFYSDVAETDFDEYFQAIEGWFGENQIENGKLKIENYLYSLFSSIDGDKCLFLQHPGGFSPFAVASRYDCGSSKASDAQVADSMTGISDSSYTVVIDEDDYKFSQTDFFYSNHLYADISLSDEDSTDSLEKLVHAAFPLASKYPFVYLGSAFSKVSGKVLQVRSFTPVNRLDIGTKAVGGTIIVYKNGVVDGSAKYDPESGTVTLSSAVAASDHITARWYEESEDSASGSFAAAGGFKYDFTEKISADISASSRWGYSPDREFADASYSSQGFATVASRVSYTGERFSVKNTVAGTYENTNTTGNYRILGNDDNGSSTYYLSKKAGIDLPGVFEPILNEKTSTGITPIELKSSKKSSVEASEGKTDSEISGYAIPLDWDFSGITAGSGSDAAWAAISLYTPGISGTLANASTFSIAIKNPAYTETFDTTKCSLYLQLGVSSDKDFSVEEADKIPTWKISESTAEQVRSSFDFSKSGWQIVKVALSDEDRSKIYSLQNFNARLILTTEDNSALPKNGTLYLGPYEAGELVFNTETESDAVCENYQTTDSNLSSAKIKKFNKNSTNKVQFFEWKFDTAQTETQKITFIRNFSQVDLSEYKKLSFFLKSESESSGDTSVTVELSRLKSNGKTETALSYEIKNPSSTWQEYTIDLTGGTNSSLTKLDTDIVPTQISIIVNTKSNGTLSFDELYLSENTPFVIAQDKIEAGYKIDGAIFETENHAILKDLKINATADGSTSIETEHGKNKDNHIGTTGKLGFTLTNLKIGTQVSLSNAYKNSKKSDYSETTQKNALDSASHWLETESPLLNLVSFSENYSFSAADTSLEKSNTAKIDFSHYSIPVSLEGSTKASSDSWSLSQSSGAKISFKPKRFTLNAESKISQKVPTTSASTSSGKEKFSTDNYFSSYAKITSFSFDTGDEKAQKRNIKANLESSYAFDTAKLTPKISFETEGSYKSSSKITFTDTTKAGFEIPFSLHKNNFSFSWKKSAGSVAAESTGSVEKGGSYSRDTSDLQKSLGEKGYFLTAFPIYDLASSGLATNVFESERESNYYTGNYAFNWKRPFFANKYDFFIPISAKLELTRDIRTGDNTTDFYQIKNTVNNTALNIFGQNGNIPLFSFFTSDEYNSSLSLALKIPRNSPSAYSYLVSGYFQATLYFTDKNYLKNGFEGSAEGKNDWKLKYTFVWKRNSASSLAKGIIGIFSTEKSEKVQRITKTDSLNMSASHTESTSSITKKYNIAYTHQTETQVTKYISLNTDVGLSWYANWGKSATLNATGTIGATIRF